MEEYVKKYMLIQDQRCEDHVHLRKEIYLAGETTEADHGKPVGAYSRLDVVLLPPNISWWLAIV